ncbi:MAG: MbtH family protein [Marinicellaceae bacterium]
MNKLFLIIAILSMSLVANAQSLRDANDKTTYNVVINHEEQYSIWPKNRANPKGWKNIGFSGTRNKCIAHIEEIWTDMRPGTLQRLIHKMLTKAKNNE